MSYVNPNYKSKKDFITAVKSGVKHETYNPSGMYETRKDGSDTVEGPHYPKPHKWYAQVTVKDGIVISAK